MGSIDTKVGEESHFDVLIIGAGISGINSAYRIQAELPHYNYAIIEARSAMGGTWDFFRYPGLRSDSDLHTFGFPWRPWSSPKSIADGQSICKYIQESAAEYGIDKRVRYRHHVTSANWSSAEQQWSLAEALQTMIPGLENFKGVTVHPQFWPEDLDYTGKKMVVIGSGATAITIIPVLARKAAMVTMLQRSPSYIISQPAVDPFGELMRKLLPKWLAFKLVRWKFLLVPFLFYQFCRVYPGAARWILKRRAERELPKNIPHDPNFRPCYNPWEQRLCASPDGDFFQALREGHADVVTDKIKTVTATGIETESGRTLDADIIVTATGLKLQLLGGATITIDSKPLELSDKYVWKGQMLQDVPNAVLVVGYTNASWTLGSDSTSLQVSRLLKYMDRHGMAYATARVPEGQKMASVPIINLSSTYVEKARTMLPRAGDTGPWKPRVNYIMDRWEAAHGSVTTDIEFTKAVKKDI
ncbi:hypothetical protein OIDMADRAFT_130179 [Oidiodendron maius Zn]|uniref:FAD/NAD(P)-binding domain-containing protein n=1 Tax=Oidiodendron maius (strain Zn) TaxID=913774 RepID=A0A0C3D6Q3_OIDMZ|nr:hypothetical protein OIDMADRAFT_130179 [Oidiodendron maius Zn]